MRAKGVFNATEHVNTLQTEFAFVAIKIKDKAHKMLGKKEDKFKQPEMVNGSNISKSSTHNYICCNGSTFTK